MESSEISQVLGRLSYAKQIQPNYFSTILNNYANKFNIQPKEIYKYLLR